ncbi:CBM96 family carbohydrate-binding protein [Paenibacillus koleovorans]|uniref:CBM96 family carbohydrate-binding protein n=1 Tax=Paenibacillus koleovorans TaxID=121608 RepID=UPI000FDAC66A|nr:DNRLRE domain-containing protein [Paenibacillus koleovorans]
MDRNKLRMGWMLVIVLSLLGGGWMLPGKAEAFTDVSSMSDQTFFGVWNGSAWTTVGKLNYAYSAGLAPVETAVKAGNYATAKSALLTYYRNRTNRTTPPLADSLRNTNVANLLKDDIFMANLEQYIGSVTVGNTYQTVTLNVQSAVEQSFAQDKNITFLLMARTKDEGNKAFYSREKSTNKPVLEVVVNGVTQTLAAMKDTYIQAGANGAVNYGTSDLLYVKSWGLPISDFERRAYIQFDMSSLAAAPTSATLKLYGANASGTGNSEIMVLRANDNSWGETSLTWNTTSGGTFSWQGSAASLDWNNPATGAYAQWINITAINGFMYTLAKEYEETGNESYASKIISLMLDFISDKGNANAAYDNSIDSARRATVWVNVYNLIVDSTSMDANANTAILKYIWKMAEWLGDTTNEYYGPAGQGSWYTVHFHGGNNWGVLETQGFYRMAVFYPEFTISSTWRNTANTRLTYLIRHLNFPDSAYSESTSSYGFGVLQEFFNVKQFGAMNGQSFSAEYDDRLLAMMKYQMNHLDPNGFDINYGDSAVTDRKPSILAMGEEMDDDELRYVGSGGTSGTVPAGTSVMYPYDMTAVMRSGWDNDDLQLRVAGKIFEPSGTARSHAHKDMLGVIVNAYGETLLPDNGNKGYDSSPLNLWLRKTEAHNAIEINNTDQSWTGVSAITYWQTNGAADFYEGYTTAASTTAGFKSTRSILFVKPNYWIVSDYITPPSGTHRYEQNWHLMPGASAVLDGTSKRTKSSFSGAPNIQIVPADPSSLTATLESSNYATAINSVQNSQRASFVKNVSGAVTFDTVLFPTQASDTSRNVTVSRLTTAPSVGTTTATALKIDQNTGGGGDVGYYYLSHEATPATARSFDKYNFNGKTAYAETNSAGTTKRASLVAGTTLKESGANLISNVTRIKDVSVEWSGTALHISGSDLIANSSSSTAIAIYAPSATSITLNGGSVAYTRVGDYVYAAGVRTAVSTLNPAADTYVMDGANAGTNFGSNTTIALKKFTSLNRTPFLRFDFGSVAGSSVSQAKLRLYLYDASSSSAKTVRAFGTYNEDWNEATLTWNGEVPERDEGLSTTTLTTTGSYYEWDVTDYVNKHWDDKKISFTLDFVTGPSGENLIFYSKESSTNKPQLVLTP